MESLQRCHCKQHSTPQLFPHQDQLKLITGSKLTRLLLFLPHLRKWIGALVSEKCKLATFPSAWQILENANKESICPFKLLPELNSHICSKQTKRWTEKNYTYKLPLLGRLSSFWGEKKQTSINFTYYILLIYLSINDWGKINNKLAISAGVLRA